MQGGWPSIYISNRIFNVIMFIFLVCSWVILHKCLSLQLCVLYSTVCSIRLTRQRTGAVENWSVACDVTRRKLRFSESNLTLEGLVIVAVPHNGCCGYVHISTDRGRLEHLATGDDLTIQYHLHNGFDWITGVFGVCYATRERHWISGTHRGRIASITRTYWTTACNQIQRSFLQFQLYIRFQ